MQQPFTGVRVLSVEPTLVEKIYQEGSLNVADVLSGVLDIESFPDWIEYPHINLVLKGMPKQTVLTSLSSDLTKVFKLRDFSKISLQGLNSKNKEQNMLLNALMNEAIRCVIVEGKAGSGKTLCTLAA